MAALEEAFWSWLKTNSTVTALLGSGTLSRAYPVVIHETVEWATSTGSSQALLSFRVVGRNKALAFRGGLASHDSKTLEVLSFSKNYLTTRALANALYTLLHGYDDTQGTLGGLTVSLIKCVEDEDDVELERFPGEVIYLTRQVYQCDYVES